MRIDSWKFVRVLLFSTLINVAYEMTMRVATDWRKSSIEFNILPGWLLIISFGDQIIIQLSDMTRVTIFRLLGTGSLDDHA